MAASNVCFTGSITIGRGLADHVPLFVMVFFRAVLGALVMLPRLAARPVVWFWGGGAVICAATIGLGRNESRAATVAKR